MTNQHSLPTISIIAAISRNGAIGYQNKLLYWLPNDLKHFKETTLGKTVIMGRKTFDSLPHGALPMRRNIVLSRQVTRIEAAEVFPSLDEALNDIALQDNGDALHEVVVIGGESIYRQAMPLAQKLYITLVDDIPAQADAFFPQIDFNQWDVISNEHHKADDRHPFDYYFITLERKQNIKQNEQNIF